MDIDISIVRGLQLPLQENMYFFMHNTYIEISDVGKKAYSKTIEAPSKNVDNSNAT